MRSYDKDETIEGEVSREKNIMDKRKEMIENKVNYHFILFLFSFDFLICLVYKESRFVLFSNRVPIHIK